MKKTSFDDVLKARSIKNILILKLDCCLPPP